MNVQHTVAAASLLLVAACTSHDQPSGPAPMSPDPTYQLTTSTRAGLRAGIDADALERLLSKLPPQSREEFLSFFLAGSSRLVLSTPNPELQRDLDAVWAPTRAPVAAAVHEEIRSGAPRPVKPTPHPEIRVALVQRISLRGAAGLVIRRAGGAEEVVVLTEDALTAAQLWTALAVAEDDRRQHGAPARDRTVVIPRLDVPASLDEATHRRVEDELGPVVAEVRGAPFQSLPGLGRARVIHLPRGR